VLQTFLLLIRHRFVSACGYWAHDTAENPAEAVSLHEN